MTVIYRPRSSCYYNSQAVGLLQHFNTIIIHYT